MCLIIKYMIGWISKTCWGFPAKNLSNKNTPKPSCRWKPLQIPPCTQSTQLFNIFILLKHLLSRNVSELLVVLDRKCYSDNSLAVNSEQTFCPITVLWQILFQTNIQSKQIWHKKVQKQQLLKHFLNDSD